MAQFSTTRLADFDAAKSGNASLAPAIRKLKDTSNPANRLSDLEIWELLATAAASGFAITYLGVAVP